MASGNFLEVFDCPTSKARIFLINEVGTSIPGRSFDDSSPVYRAMRVVTEFSDKPNTNEFVVSVKIPEANVDDPTAGIFYDNFNHRLLQNQTSGNSTDTLTIIDQFITPKGIYVVTFPYMEKGSIYQVMVKKFKFCMSQNWVVFILKKLLASMSFRSDGGHICASQIFMNGLGGIKVGYGVTAMKFNNDPSVIGLHEWPYLEPQKLWELSAPEQRHATHDTVQAKVDIWHFGLTALELLYCGVRAPRAFPESLYSAIEDIVAAGRLPAETLQFQTPAGFEEPPEDAYCVNGLPIFHPKRKLSSLSREFQRLVISCLNSDPLKRPTLEELNDHPLFKMESNMRAENLLWD